MNKYNISDVLEFAKKYRCEILNSNNLTTFSNKLLIKSRCGHITTDTVNNFIKKKIGIYCKECMNKIVHGDKDIDLVCSNSNCNKIFKPNPNEKIFLFCSKFCCFSREKNEKTKAKISLKIKNIMREKENNKDEPMDNKNIFLKGNIYLNSLIENKFNFEITNRCCYYNHIIKPFNIKSSNGNTDKVWFPIEIKYSNSSLNNYLFRMKEKYKEILIICISLEDNKIWLFPPNTLDYVTKLKINKESPNKFDKYIVNPLNLHNILEDYYNNYQQKLVCKNDNFMEIKETNAHIKVEYEFKKKRLDYINFIEFQNPISNFEPFNFLINDYKIQECVSFITKSYPKKKKNNINNPEKNNNLEEIVESDDITDLDIINDYELIPDIDNINSDKKSEPNLELNSELKKKYHVVSIHKKRNGFSIPFHYTDCDFFWFHERNYNNFYLVPSSILNEKGFLNSESNKGKMLFNIDKNTDWLSEYKFSYDSINQEPFKTNFLKFFGLN